MPFKIRSELPTRYSSFEEWADYAEYKALKSGSQIRLQSLFRNEILVLDELLTDGIEDEEIEITALGENLLSELNRRNTLLGDKYPFELDEVGYILKLKNTTEQENILYRFLLFATCLNMKINRNQGGVDGTFIFEKLSSMAIQIYFGSDSKTFVFGTSTVGGFNIKIKELINNIGEGGAPKLNSLANPKDDKVDIVVWKDFNDKKSSKFIAFGQCKTGTEWHADLEKLNTENFCKKWFTNHPLVLPSKFFCCSQYFPYKRWETDGYSAGIIFDRFRILEFINKDLPKDLFDEIKSWTESAQAFSIAS